MMTPPPLRDHQPRCGLGDDEGGSDIQPEQQVEGRLVDFEKGLRPVDAGIVDQNVEAAEAGEGVAHRVRAGDVEHQRPRLAAARLDLAGDFVELARGPADEHQLGSGTRQAPARGAADAASGAGHQRGLAVEAKRAIRGFRRHRIPEAPRRGARLFSPAGVKLAELGPEALGVGRVDLHPSPRELFGPGGVHLLDVVALQQREFLGIALDDFLHFARQSAPGCAIGQQA